MTQRKQYDFKRGAEGGLRGMAHLTAAVVAAAGLGVLAAFPLAWEDQAVVGLALFALAWGVHRFSRSRLATLTLVLASAFTTVRYLWWRFAETYSYLSYHAGEEHWTDLIFVALLLGAETYAFLILVLGYFQSAQPLERKPSPLPADPNDWPTVDVLIPTYNEPVEVLKPTLLAALNLDWPADKFRVWVLDDGCRDEIRELAERHGADYVARADSRFAKAGNLNNTLRRTDGELVAIFDCDHAPTRSFLQLTAGAFLKDRRLAMLQTPHHFYTPDPIERNLGVFREIPNEGSLFYGVIQKGNDLWNATSFAGSCAVLRRTALDQIGGIAVETVTEDAHTSLRMQKQGWNTAYLGIPQAAGLAAFSLRDHVNQRIRWARGLTQILRIEKPFWSRDLTWAQRLCYFNSSIHFLYALPRLIFLMAPLGFLLFDLSNFYGYVLAILAYAVPHLLLATMANARLQGAYRNPYWNEVFETILAPFILIPTTLALISPRKGVFNVTPKSMSRNAKRYDWLMASPFLVIAALNLTGIGVGVQRILSGQGEIGTLAINIAWAAYSTMIVGVALAIAEEPREDRAVTRVPMQAPVFATLAGGQRIEAQTQDLSYRGVRIQSPDAVSLAEGDSTIVGFDLFGEELRIRGRVVRVDKWTAQIRFLNLTPAQEEAVTRIIFSRADAWIDWDAALPEQFSPWKSMAKVFGLSLVGFGRVITALFRRAPKPQPAVADVREARNQPALPVIGLLLLVAGLAAAPAAAQTPDASAPSRGNTPFHETHSFSEFGLKQPIELRGPHAEQAFRFWSPVTKVVEQASLELDYQAAPGAAGAGRLLIYLNDAQVSSLPLASSAAGLERAAVELPADLFVGDNELLFALERACEPDCQGSADAGWARIELGSEIRLAGKRLPVALELGMLPMPLLDLSVHRPVEINLAVSRDAEPAELEAAGIAASWLGVLANHRGVRFAAQVDRLPAGHTVVVATSNSDLAAALGLAGQTRAAIALVQHPTDPYGTVLALVGLDGEDVKQAARALALGKFPKTGSIAEVGDLELPAPSRANDAPRWMDPSRPILFQDFADGSGLRVLGDSALDLYLRTPPGLDHGSKRRLPLTLRYRVHDLPADASASLTVFMNGVFLGETRLDGAESADMDREDVFPVPADAVYPNSTLRVSLRVTDRGDETAAAYPAVEIAGDSELDLSGFHYFAALPRLDLFAGSGFPFTRRADLSETAVVLDERPDPAALGLYFDLMGLFGARTGAAALRVTVAPGASSADGKDALVIAAPGSTVFDGWDDGMTVALSGPDFDLRRDSWASETLRLLSWGRFERQRADLARALRSAPRIDALLQGAETPARGRSVVAVALRSEEAGEQLINALESATGTAAVYGSLSFLSGDELQSFTAAPPTFYVGEASPRALVDLWLRRFLWLLPLLALLFAFTLAYVLKSRLERLAVLRLEATS